MLDTCNVAEATPIKGCSYCAWNKLNQNEMTTMFPHKTRISYLMGIAINSICALGPEFIEQNIEIGMQVWAFSVN